MLKIPKSVLSDVDSLNLYLWMIGTASVQKGMMVQPAILTLAVPPSKVRGTCVKSPGPTSLWEPKISS